MNDDATNHADGDPGSGGGRISQDRRLLTNIGLAGKESFEGVLAVAKVLDRSSPDSRRSAIFKSVAELETLRGVMEDTEGLLRDIAIRGVFPLEPPRAGEGGRVARVVARVKFWWATR